MPSSRPAPATALPNQQLKTVRLTPRIIANHFWGTNEATGVLHIGTLNRGVYQYSPNKVALPGHRYCKGATFKLRRTCIQAICHVSY